MSTVRGKFSNLLDRIAKAVHLSAEKAIKWYAYILFLIPIAFWLMIEMRVLSKGQSWAVMLKQPAVAIGTVVAIVDFMVGYYLLLRRQDFLASYKNYRFFMIWQAIGQILVGNIICFVLALIGMHEAKSLDTGTRSLTVTMVSVVSGLLLLLCSSLIVMVEL